MHPTASLAVTAAFVALPIAVAGVLAYGWVRASPSSRSLGWRLVAIWLGAWGALGASGVLRNWTDRPPPMFVALILTLVVVVAAARSRVGARFADGVPVAALVGFHAFRLPLELAMHRAADEGTMPMHMSFAGANFDIVTGISAVVVALLASRGLAPRWLVLGFAVISTALLFTIMGIAIASTPPVAAFGPDKVATWVGWFPFAWLPGVLVPAALFGQLVLFRRLFADAKRAAPVRLRTSR